MATDAEVRHGVESEPRRLRPGWQTIAAKEFADHLLSARFLILLILLALVAVGAVYTAADSIRDVAPEASEAPAVFLRLFTVSPEQVPSFFTLVAFLVPLLGIAFGFDAVNGERSQGTLSRLVSQPVYRDDVINGKFTAGLIIIALVLSSLTVLVAGVGLVRLGIVPAAEDVARVLTWLLVTIVYVGFWLAFATLCSVGLRRAATSALVAIGVWLVLTLFGRILAGLLADVIRPVSSNPTVDELISNARLELALSRISPSTLYEEATTVLLNPEVRTLGILLPQQVDRAVRSNLSLDQSLLLVWPQTVGLAALTVVFFAIAYVLFMRQEVRA